MRGPEDQFYAVGGMSVDNEKESLEKKADFSGEDLNTYFKTPSSWEGLKIKDEITSPFLTCADYDGCGGGFEVKKEFFTSKYYSQDGLLWMLDYLQSIQDTIAAEEAAFYENVDTRDQELNHESQEQESDFLFDNAAGDLLDTADIMDLYDYELSLQRSFVLENLSKVKTDRKTVDSLINFLQLDVKSHVYPAKLAEALSRADINYASKRLMDLIREKSTDAVTHSQYKNDIAKIIYRLEFGKINISSEGVRYLEKMYDLGESNNPDYFVNRLTGNGDIGVFDEDGVLQKYFNLGDLAAEESLVRPQVLDFTIETLFFGKSTATEEEKKIKEKYLQEFKENYFKFYDDEFTKKTGIRFNNLEFEEQGQFLIYYKHANAEKKEILLGFIKQFGENGFRTFLSLEHGGQEMGEKILKIGEKFNTQTADKIFAKYAELVDQAERAADYLAKEFHWDDKSQAQKVSEYLLRRGKALLALCADEDFSAEQIYKKLEGIKGEIELFSASLLAAKEDGVDVDFEMIRNLKTESTYSPKVSSIEEITALAKKSWEDNVQYNGVNPEFSQKLLNNLRDSLLNANDTETILLRYKDQIIGMLRFGKVDDETLEVKSVTIDSSFKGLNVGKFLFKLIEKKSLEKNLILDVLLKNEIGCHYIDKLGFVGYGINDNALETGEPNIYAKLSKGMFGKKPESKIEGDIEKEFDISTQDGLAEMVSFLKEHLSEIGSDGQITNIKSEKYHLYKMERRTAGKADIRKILLRKA